MKFQHPVSLNPPLQKGGWGDLPTSIRQVLARRSLNTSEAVDAFLTPSLDRLASPQAFDHMQIAVDRLLSAVRNEHPIAIYADRDVDGLTGQAVLVRTLRTLGGTVVYGSPVRGRGLEREVLETLSAKAQVMVLVDCGTGEHEELRWLADQGIDVIVADHHRLSGERPPALAWIHPEVQQLPSPQPSPFKGEGVRVRDGVAPAGCVMAFKLAQAIWQSFLGTDDPARMDYFLFSHLDLIALGILADRMPLLGENRILVWHGLRRLAHSRKTGVSALIRFFHLSPSGGALSVRQVTWQLIPLLNAGGRLGRPDFTADLLITEDPDVARERIDQLLQLNQQRRAAQDVSVASFEKAVLEQCSVQDDPVLVALAEGLEPSVTGLAAQSLVRKYGRPAFLFVSQGEQSVGSGRGLPGVDLFSWIEAHQDFLVKYGGHSGAVGLTIRTADFAALRGRLMTAAHRALAKAGALLFSGEHSDISSTVEAALTLNELDREWWQALCRLAPFGMGHPMPLFQIDGVESITPVVRKRSKKPAEEFVLKSGGCELQAKFEQRTPSSPSPFSLPREKGNANPLPMEGEGGRSRQTSGGPSGSLAGPGEGGGPLTVLGYPAAVRQSDDFCWIIREVKGRKDADVGN